VVNAPSSLHKDDRSHNSWCFIYGRLVRNSWNMWPDFILNCMFCLRFHI